MIGRDVWDPFYKRWVRQYLSNSTKSVRLGDMKTDDEIHEESMKDPEYREAWERAKLSDDCEDTIEDLCTTIDLKEKTILAQGEEIHRLRSQLPARESMFPNGDRGPEDMRSTYFVELARHHVWDDHNQEKWITTRERRDFGISLSVSEDWDNGPEARIRFTPQQSGYPDVISMTVEDLDGFIEELQGIRAFMKQMREVGM